MPNIERRLILSKGETICETTDHKWSGQGSKAAIGRKVNPVERLKPQLENLFISGKSIPSGKRLDKKLFFAVALDSHYLGSSYFPRSLLINSFNWEFVGSRPIIQYERDGDKLHEPSLARLLFLSSTLDIIHDAYDGMLNKRPLSDTAIKDCDKIDKIFTLNTSDIVLFKEKYDEDQALELILHPLKNYERQEVFRKIHNILSDSRNDDLFKKWFIGNGKRPVFVPAIVRPDELEQLSSCNFLRAIRPMPRINIPKTNPDKIIQLGGIQSVLTPRGQLTPPEIGVFDGGADTSLPQLAQFVEVVDVTKENIDNDLLDHGTAVCGAVLYGDLNQEQLRPPDYRVRCFRVFPSPKEYGIDLDLYHVCDWIENVVKDKKNQHIKLYVLSFGPQYPIEDNEVSPFTEKLDQLSHEYDVLFVVAAGNTGDCISPFNRIQPAADIVNGFGVGAHDFNNDGIPIPTSYSCVGPGRVGAQHKPDISAFGGTEDNPFFVFTAGKPGLASGIYGTSFAAPLVGRSAGFLLHQIEDDRVVTPQAVRALICHSAEEPKGWNKALHGPGILQEIDDILICPKNSVTVIYNGTLKFHRWERLGLFFPNDISGALDIKLTLAYSSAISAATPDEYTLAGNTLRFYPDANTFKFSPQKNSEEKPVTCNVIKEPTRFMELKQKGYTQSRMPSSTSYKREQSLRKDGKWDNIRQVVKSCFSRSLYDPAFYLYTHSRGEWSGNNTPNYINYAAIVTITMKSKTKDLYKAVRSQFRELVPIQLRARARRRTTV